MEVFPQRFRCSHLVCESCLATSSGAHRHSIHSGFGDGSVTLRCICIPRGHFLWSGRDMAVHTLFAAPFVAWGLAHAY